MIRTSPRLALATVSLALFAGCGGSESTTMTPPTQEIHTTRAFSDDQINAPLGSKAKPGGNQVAGPPTR